MFKGKYIAGRRSLMFKRGGGHHYYSLAGEVGQAWIFSMPIPAYTSLFKSKARTFLGFFATGSFGSLSPLQLSSFRLLAEDILVTWFSLTKFVTFFTISSPILLCFCRISNNVEIPKTLQILNRPQLDVMGDDFLSARNINISVQ